MALAEVCTQFNSIIDPVASVEVCALRVLLNIIIIVIIIINIDIIIVVVVIIIIIVIIITSWQGDYVFGNICMSVCLFFCLVAVLFKNLWMNFD